MSLDLGTNLSEVATKGAFCHLSDPVTGVPLVDENGDPVGLILAGADGEQYAKAKAEVARKQLREQERQGRKWKWSAEAVEQGELDILVACSLGWKGASYGSDSTFTPDLMRKLYVKESWIKAQADAFVHERASFGGALRTA